MTRVRGGGSLIIAMLCTSVGRAADEPVTITGLQFPVGLADGGYSFEVLADGTAEFVARGGKGSRRQLTPEERHTVRRLVVDTGVLEVKGELGSCQIEGLSRVLTVAMGARSTRVTLCDWESEERSTRTRARKALAVWVSARRLFPDKYPASERELDERQLKSDAAEQ